MNSTLVSVIVPCFNQAPYLNKALNSILAQTYTEWECIVINDGSTDNTEEIIQEFVSKDNRFKSISTSNFGVCMARNTAINRSKGKYLFPLDGDDYIHPECLEKCIAVFFNNPAIRLVCPQGEFFGFKKGVWELPSYSFKILLKHNIIHNSSMYLREDFDLVGGYRLNMGSGLEDWDLWIALLNRYSDNQVVIIKETLFYYRATSNSRTTGISEHTKFSSMTDNIVFNNYQIYKKNFPDIFLRIQRYDYNNIMMNKPLVKAMVCLYNTFSKIKALYMHQKK